MSQNQYFARFSPRIKLNGLTDPFIGMLSFLMFCFSSAIRLACQSERPHTCSCTFEIYDVFGFVIGGSKLKPRG
jgi:hypothetical protein